MSVPTLVGLNLLNAADSATNWSGWGQNSAKWSLEADIIKEGGGSHGIAPFQTGDGGYGYTAVGGVDLTTNLLMIWVYTTPGFADTFDNYGVYVRICSGASWTTEFSDFKVGGSDVAWFGRGWHLIVLDCSRTADRSNGSTNKASVARVGVGFNITATASKSTIMAIDIMRYGNTLEVTSPSLLDASNGIDLLDNGGGDDTIVRNDGGSFVTDGWEIGDYVRVAHATTSANDGVYGPLSGVSASTLTLPTGSLSSSETADLAVRVLCSVTLEDIYQKDGPTDDAWKGVVDKDPSGVYVVNYPLTLGDVSGGNSLFFYTSGRAWVLADQPVNTTREDYLISAEDTGETYIRIGNSTGTGDGRTGFAGTSITAQASVFASVPVHAIDFSAAITSLEVYGATIGNLAGPVDFPQASGSYYIATTSFVNCGQVDVGQVETRNVTCTGYTGSAGALLWNEDINIKYSNFLANTIGIEHPSASSSPYAYVGLLFAGNAADVNNTSGTGLTIQKTENANPTTYTGSSVSFTANYNHTVTGLDSGSRVIWIRQSDGAELENKVEVSGEAFYTHSGGDVDVWVQILDLNKKNKLVPVTLGDANATLPAAQENDPFYANP